ncbi:hypothetical protein CEP54_014972 [Fusarium duplospermum]|uniref:RING-type domain-containing protein n=1 Tax=Fusarium duplospermum TaxID=1325734 RepID=A0A428NSH8_9HYPO|nr:hypothetical protein CEP54_014972 [Fusarium duplospermum]
MARHHRTMWLSLCSRASDTDLLVSDRVQAIIDCIPNPDVQQPSLLVLIGNAAKSIALRELFSVRRTRRFSLNQNPAEVHLHVDPLSVFSEQPLVIVDGDLSEKLNGKLSANKGDDVTRRAIRRPREKFGFSGPAGGIYAQLLSPFVNVYCFFCDDLGGFKRVARHLAAWLEHNSPSTMPPSMRPRVVVVTERIPVGAESEREALATLLALMRMGTDRNVLDYISAIEVIALLPDGSISIEGRYRSLKERVMASSDQIRSQRQDAHTLFSATHLAALLESACEHFSDTLGEPFNLIKSCRAHNPQAIDLSGHLSTFLAYIKSPIELTSFAAPVIASSFFLDNYPPGAHHFAPGDVFNLLYEGSLTNASKHGALSFEEPNDVMLQSNFVNLVRREFERYAHILIQGSKLAAEIHIETLSYYKSHWLNIHSTSVCLACLRRIPSYDLPCGHMICGNCVRVFGEESKDDPYVFVVQRCLLCQVAMPEDICIRMHPPTVGAGILCIDGGGVRGTMPLQIMKRIKDRIALPIPLQRFIKVAFGISSGGLIVADMFINGSSIEDSSDKFEALAKHVFQRRKYVNAPFLPKFLTTLLPLLIDSLPPLPSFLYLMDIAVSYFTDGLYPSRNMEDALKRVFSSDRSMLGISNATVTGTLVGLPAATVDEKPKCRIFSNYHDGVPELYLPPLGM